MNGNIIIILHYRNSILLEKYLEIILSNFAEICNLLVGNYGLGSN